MPNWFDIWQIVAACLICGYLGSHSRLVAVLAVAMTLCVCWLGNWFTFLDAYGLAMLILPAFCAATGSWIGDTLRRRQREADAANTFVPPPPPPGWKPKRHRRATPPDDVFRL